MKILAFDIGGTKIAHALVDEQGNLISERSKNDTPKTAAAIETLLRNVIAQYENEIDAVAIATAGAVDNDNTRIISSIPNLPKGYDKTDFAVLSSKPVVVENDANAVAWAEYFAGAGKGCRHMIVVAIGTGVGFGIIIDGKMLRGKSGTAGEAHYPINRGRKRKCGCGAYDCFEIYTSGKALALDAQEAFNNPQMTTHQLIELKQKGDAKAMAVFDEWCGDIVSGIRGLATLFDPEKIILFGSLVEYIDVEKMAIAANQEIVASPFKLEKARFGNNAALIGAALLAVDKLKN